MQKLLRSLLMLILLLQTAPVWAAEIRIAVASNFSDAFRDLVRLYHQHSEHKVVPVFGSTGKHYAQIRNGAPFHAFFAADRHRPGLLEQEGVIQPGSRFTYAIGTLVLWSPDAELVDDQGSILQQIDHFRYLSMANPKLAPYGRAAQQVLQQRAAWQSLQGRMVRGENIGQAYQFVKSGNAQLGFVAYSQIHKPGQAVTGSFWLPPRSSYSPIEQQAVLLQDHPVAVDFLAFVRSNQGQKIISAYGYALP